MEPKVWWVIAVVTSLACGSETGQVQFARELDIDMAAMTRLESGLALQDLVIGDGREALAGSSVTVHYAGWLADGTKFESSRERGETLSFVVGKGEVIAGWEEGVVGMRAGGKRKLVLPPGLAYGRFGAPPVIPPNATLVFEIELLAVN